MVCRQHLVVYLKSGGIWGKMKEDNKVIDSSRIEFLDYLKAICVLMVIITHYDWTDKTSPFFTICFIEIILLYLEDRTINLPRIFLLEGYEPGSYYVPVMLQLLAFFCAFDSR